MPNRDTSAVRRWERKKGLRQWRQMASPHQVSGPPSPPELVAGRGFIYFSSDRGGDFQVWQAPTTGEGAAVQVTRSGGFAGFESPGGRVVYYTKTPQSGQIWRTGWGRPLKKEPGAGEAPG